MERFSLSGDSIISSTTRTCRREVGPPLPPKSPALAYPRKRISYNRPLFSRFIFSLDSHKHLAFDAVLKAMYITPALLENALAIARVHVRSWQVAYAGILEPGFLDKLSVEARARRWHDILTRAETPKADFDPWALILDRIHRDPEIRPQARPHVARWVSRWQAAGANASAEATEETYMSWIRRLSLFRLRRLRLPGLRDFDPNHAAQYLDYLALERQVSPATQNQALNAMDFLSQKVHGMDDFQIGT